MIDRIKILPDSIANQIAAGEVIQRPASVVKELIENAVDAKSTKITVNIKDAGKTLIQVIDNGFGMSETDARLAFERHSTSKIESSEDLFNLHTKGFRGEALASIASIAQVELKTKTDETQVGTLIEINGSELIKQEDIVCKTGSSFAVKNLFFNVPARRRFLKADSTELRHIIAEFKRVALTHPEIEFELINNDTTIYHLRKAKLKQRISDVYDRLGKQLIPILNDNKLVKIYGFVGKPENAKKNSTEQYFFANKRFMKSAYFNKAISLSFNNLIAKDAKPVYFIFFEISPKLIDINIHPTKTEINFEDGQAIFQILMTTVKNTLAKHNVIPAIDFDKEGFVDVKTSAKNTDFKIPQIETNPNYNPFDEEIETKSYNYHKKIATYKQQSQQPENWESAFEILRDTQKSFIQPEADKKLADTNSNIISLKGKYIITTLKSGLMIIDKNRAYERILFDEFEQKIQTVFENSQPTLYPITINFSEEELIIFEKIKNSLLAIGFKFSEKENSVNELEINAFPTFIESENSEEIIKDFIEQTKNYDADIAQQAKQKVVQTLAKSSAKFRKSSNSPTEMRTLIDRLFATQSPNYTADGRKIISIIKTDEVEKMFVK